MTSKPEDPSRKSEDGENTEATRGTAEGELTQKDLAEVAGGRSLRYNDVHAAKVNSIRRFNSL